MTVASPGQWSSGVWLGFQNITAGGHGRSLEVQRGTCLVEDTQQMAPQVVLSVVTDGKSLPL